MPCRAYRMRLYRFLATSHSPQQLRVSTVSGAIAAARRSSSSRELHKGAIGGLGPDARPGRKAGEPAITGALKL